MLLIHRSWQKTRLLIQRMSFIISQHRHVCITSPCPSNPMGELQKTYKHIQVCSGLSYRSGALKLGGPPHLSKSRLSPRGSITSSFSIAQSLVSHHIQSTCLYLIVSCQQKWNERWRLLSELLGGLFDIRGETQRGYK